MVTPDRTEQVQRPNGCSIAARIYNSDARKTLVFSNGLGCGETHWRHLLDDLATDHRVITWDYRGQGDSSAARGPGAYSARAHAADITAVQDMAGVEVAVHVGYGLGALVALEHHSWAPERVEALVLIQGGFSLTSGNLTILPASIRRFLGEMAPLSSLAGRFLSRRQDRKLLRGIHSLAKVQVPTLVLGSSHDPLCPEPLMRLVHESLDNSEYDRLPVASHACLVDAGPIVAARIRRFLAERRSQRTWNEF